MEKVIKVQGQQKSLKLLQEHSPVKTGGCLEISLYKGPLSPEGIAKATKMIMGSFPDLDKNWYEVFFERVKEKKFSDKRLIDSIINMVDNCIYNKPKIADFIKFDRRIKLYNYFQMLKLNDEMKGVFRYFIMIEIEGQKFWINKKDYEQNKMFFE